MRRQKALALLLTASMVFSTNGVAFAANTGQYINIKDEDKEFTFDGEPHGPEVEVRSNNGIKDYELQKGDYELGGDTEEIDVGEYTVWAQSTNGESTWSADAKQWRITEEEISKATIELEDFETDLPQLTEAARNDQAVHHSRHYNEVYHPHYRIVERSIFERELKPSSK